MIQNTPADQMDLPASYEGGFDCESYARHRIADLSCTCCGNPGTQLITTEDHEGSDFTIYCDPCGDGQWESIQERPKARAAQLAKWEADRRIAAAARAAALGMVLCSDCPASEWFAPDYLTEHWQREHGR